MRSPIPWIVQAGSLVVFAATMALTPTNTLGCGCCAEPYDHTVRRGLMPYEMSQLASTSLEGEWAGWMFELGPWQELKSHSLRLGLVSTGWQLIESASRDQTVLPDSLTPAGTFSWQLEVLKDGRIVDSLLFRYDSVHQTMSDLRLVLAPRDYDSLIGADAETVLAKKVRLFGTLGNQGQYLSDHGINIDGPAELWFHGRGNVCFGAGDFSDWTLSAQRRSMVTVAHGRVVVD